MDGKKEVEKKQEIDRFKFSVTLLTAFGTILYVVYNYFQNAAITNDGVYRLVKSIIEFSIVSSFFFIIYLSLIGASVGAKGTLKGKLQNWASKIYSITFIIMGIEVLKMVLFLMFSSLDEIFSIKVTDLYSMLDNSMLDHLLPKSIIFLILSIIIYTKWFSRIFRPSLTYNRSKIKPIILRTGFIMGFLVSIFLNGLIRIIFSNLIKFIVLIFIFVIIYFFIKQHYSIKFKDWIESNKDSVYLAVIFIICGVFINLNYAYIDRIPEYVTVEKVDFNMESIFYKSDKLIHASIDIKGTNCFIHASLYKEDFNHTFVDDFTLNQIEYVTMWDWIKGEKNASTKITAFGNNSTLFGTVLDKQSYDIFINTKDLDEGYYLLVISPNNAKNYSKGFYLLNQQETRALCPQSQLEAQR